MDEMTMDSFVYIILLALALLNIFLFEMIMGLKARASVLERQMRELHRIVLSTLPNEE